MNAREQLLKQFDQPSVEHRSIPFWAWNDELDSEELARQVNQMKEQGMGGFFIHSRDGLETEYMGREWLDCVRRTVDTAAELGMQVWLYDEDRWPSGFAGGLVQASGGDASRAKGLTMEVVRGVIPAEKYADAVALFTAVIDERNLLRCKKLQLDERYELKEDEVLLVFRVEISERSEWFNNEAPPDNLNPETVRTFLDITYEAYKREVGDQFGRTIRGVFTDEPSVHDRHCRFTEGRGWLPWSWSFPEFFQERRGYDLMPLIPYMYFNGEYSSQARHDYWRTLTERFSESYSKQLGEWCENNGIAFTGHYLWENNMGTATRVCGAVMPNYRFQQVPGIDMLNEQINEYITVKQCTSVANQYGRKHVLTETYGCTGWGFTFEGQKWIGDFQYVLGVNVRSQHLALYSIKGCRKRDYPPVFNYNTSWWKYNHVVEDYFARLSAVLTEGRPLRDVLVLHPSSTAWSMVGTGPYGFPARGKDKDVSATNHFGHEFNDFLGGLLKAHYDFDLGDETIMAETGEVRGNQLAVYLAKYRIVVIPPILTMLESTLKLLLDFLNNGGKIVAAGACPTMIEGRKAESKLSQLYCHENMSVVQDIQETVKTLESMIPRRVSITNDRSEEAHQMLYMLRETFSGDCRILFIVNNDREEPQRVNITLEGNVSIEEWCALTGQKKAIEITSFIEGNVRFEAEFGPADSKLYVCTWNETSSDEEINEAIQDQVEQSVETIVELGPSSRFTRSMPNVLTLDMCSYRYGDSGWSEVKDVWKAQRAIREALGMKQVYGNGIEQRYKWIHNSHPGNGVLTDFKFSFYVSELPVKEVFLVVESAEYYEIQLNGIPVHEPPNGWFLDRSFDKVLLQGIRKGSNEIILTCKYHQRMEVEDIYLIGDFAVDMERKITTEPEMLGFGDWCSQGYYHYCGSMIYHFDVSIEKDKLTWQTFLELGEYSAITVEVRVNGQTAGHVPWKAANLVDLTQLLHAGMNQLDIEVMSSPRNMLGPFHLASGEPSTTSWASFRREGSDYTSDYKVRPYGLFGQIKLHRKVNAN
ncbi:glycosyl hydrolase [Paenibacillus sp. UNC451MF]|uniref:glycosyl hydrolase n=1 Tax=Paenibacillus sp. UNC451MF TaxID=1449063 RepID=UPI000491B4A6|nr:glycosyl hydrolase [Paenibacillus sp. UNC451MF]